MTWFVQGCRIGMCWHVSVPGFFAETLEALPYAEAWTNSEGTTRHLLCEDSCKKTVRIFGLSDFQHSGEVCGSGAECDKCSSGFELTTAFACRPHPCHTGGTGLPLFGRTCMGA